MKKTKDTIYYRDKRAHNRFHYRFQWHAYLLILPAFIFVTIFVVAPLIISFVRSFFEYETGIFNKGMNYVMVLTDPEFLITFRNVFFIALMLVVLMLTTSFLYANCLNSLDNKLSRFARTMIFVPFFISGIISSLMFSTIFDVSEGLIGYLYYTRGVYFDADIPGGLTHVTLAGEYVIGGGNFWPYFLIILPTWWGGFGYQALMMFAGIINIPKEYYEAASIDGASATRKMFSITLPNMKNYFVLVLVNLVTGYFQMFEIPKMMTGGGPEKYSKLFGMELMRTESPVLWLYSSVLGQAGGPDRNIAVAGAFLIMVFVTIANILVFKVFKSEKSMDS